MIELNVAKKKEVAKGYGEFRDDEMAGRTAHGAQGTMPSMIGIHAHVMCDGRLTCFASCGARQPL